MADKLWGSLNSKQIHIRYWCPCYMTDWQSGRFSWWLAMNPMNWIRTALCRNEWDLCWSFHRDCNGRCYCPVGSNLTVRIEICGFGMILWRSIYDGPVPCVCDEVMAELFPQEAE